ncbi:MAG: hypothetical protein OR997_05200 [Methylophilaceae bacterium]|nr:hypothetical protein [Methylophilaceae bacterium]
MKRSLTSILIITFLLNVATAFATFKVEMIDGMAPKNWILVYYTLGNMNRDSKDDAISVVKNIDRSYLKINTVIGPKILNINPREMLILFQK